MEDFQEIHIAHIYCEGNGLANGLAKFGHGVTVLWNGMMSEGFHHPSLIPYE
jgi:hypothetical protein